MPKVDELVALFKSMDEEAQEYTLATARLRAKRCPQKPAGLRLVAGQLGNRPLGRELGTLFDLEPPPVRCTPVLIE